jgi:hypothetical protein
MIRKFINIIMRSIRSKKSGWSKGNFRPLYPEKCINIKKRKPIIYRSSWEQRFMNWCDTNSNVVLWGSEIFEIPYIYDIDKKLHRYYPDIYCEVKDNSGQIVKYLVEIKPKKQLKPPNPPKNKTYKALRNFNYSLMEHVKNKNKWKYAKRFCDTRNYKFKVITEDRLF